MYTAASGADFRKERSGLKSEDYNGGGHHLMAAGGSRKTAASFYIQILNIMGKDNYSHSFS